jgi:hypothetical protein
MANIGNLAVTLSLDAVALTTGLDKSSAGMKTFAAGVGKTMAVVSAAETAFAAVKAPFDWVKEGIDKVAEVGRESQRFGVSTEKLSALQMAAGRDAESWQSALRHLNVELGAAAAGGGEASKKFKDVGLDGKALAAMGLDRSLDVLADSFQKIKDPAERARLAQELFGREASVLIPILSRGSAGFAEADAAAKKLGMSVSSVDAAKAIVAQRAMDDLGKSLEGIQRGVAIEFAPVIADVAKGFADMVSKAGGFRELIKGWGDAARSFVVTMLAGIETIAVKIADLAEKAAKLLDKLDGSKKGKSWADKLDPVGEARGIGNAFNLAREVFAPGSTYSKEGATESWGKSVQSTFDSLKDAVGGKGDSGMADAIRKTWAELDKLGKPAGDAAEGANKLQDAADKLTDKLKAEVAAFGQGAPELERFKLAQDGATAAQLAGVDAQLAQLQALKDSKKAMEELEAQAKKVADAAATPFEKFRSSYDQVNQLLAAGKIGQAQYAEALSKNFESLGLMSDKVMHPSGAALEGSVAAYQTVMHAQDQERAGDVQQQIKQAIERLIEIERRQEAHAKQMADAIDKVLGKK